MKSQAYEQRNMMGFEGDTIMKNRIKKLIADHGINLVIEGGTYLGGTARQFALMASEVVTIEINQAYFAKAVLNLALCSNVRQYHGDTVEILPAVLAEKKNKKILFFSDAHWYDHNPMLAELEIIKHSGVKPIIAIHDFKVPGRADLSFDTYGGQDYEWEWIRESIEDIYGVDGFTIEYNTQATGAKRGIIYIIPK